jgi:hypothetical protein
MFESGRFAYNVRLHAYGYITALEEKQVKSRPITDRAAPVHGRVTAPLPLARRKTPFFAVAVVKFYESLERIVGYNFSDGLKFSPASRQLPTDCACFYARLFHTF